MAFLSSLDISGSALTASRLRMDVISENIANASTTRTQAGGPYRRKMVVYRSADQKDSFRSLLDQKLEPDSQAMGGVQVEKIVEDQTPFNTVYDPSHPDADAQGYVQMPNVDVTKETMDMMSVTRAYSANINALGAVKNMAAKALEIGK
ncbi:MAG: flagellar basal body rod protein FlgC [Oscillospiraceae bacterium]|jgi:flagellar basal-body rod protein FlgC|nr:flagellar basal body rod protein FlgC [Oscillospiraceae bacterium]